MKRLKVAIFICLALMLVLMPLVGACAKKEEPAPAPAPPPEKPIVIRFTTTWPPVDPTVVVTKELESIIPEATNGRVKFEMYPGGQLYGMVEEIMAVQKGDVEMTWGGGCLSVLSPEWDAMTNLPFIFEDEAHFQRFLETGAGKALLDRMAAMGLKHIAYIGAAGATNLYNNKHPVATLDDLKGVKYAMPPFPTLAVVAEEWGIQTVSLATPEVATAIETGMMDGITGNVSAALAWNLKELCPYVTICKFGISADFFAINTTFWNSLPADIQQVLAEVFAEQAQKLQTMRRQQVEQHFVDIEAAGGVVTRITGAERDIWRAAAQPAYDLVMQDPNVKEVVEAIESVR